MESYSFINITDNEYPQLEFITLPDEYSTSNSIILTNECPICLLELDNDIILDCCSQKLHKKCYNKCVSYKLECPLCRNTDKFINKSQYKYIYLFKNNLGNIFSIIMIVGLSGCMLLFVYNIIMICYKFQTNQNNN